MKTRLHQQMTNRQRKIQRRLDKTKFPSSTKEIKLTRFFFRGSLVHNLLNVYRAVTARKTAAAAIPVEIAV